LTVADINRLEQAARISMGEFMESETSPETVPHSRHGLIKGIALALALAAIVIVAAFLLLT
jgi:hypothetical protein